MRTHLVHAPEKHEEHPSLHLLVPENARAYALYHLAVQVGRLSYLPDLGVVRGGQPALQPVLVVRACV